MITDVSMETAKTILELATNAESLWKMASPQERKEFLEQLLSNPVLNGTTVEYQIRKPFVTLSEMKQDENWRREWDSNPRYLLQYTRFPSVRLRRFCYLSPEKLRQITGS